MYIYIYYIYILLYTHVFFDPFTKWELHPPNTASGYLTRGMKTSRPMQASSSTSSKVFQPQRSSALAGWIGLPKTMRIYIKLVMRIQI